MSNPMREPGRAVAATVLFVALAWGTGNAAWGAALVTDLQADLQEGAAAVAAQAVDAAANEERAAEAEVDATIVETVIWPEREAPPAWFATPADDADVDLTTLTPSPMKTPGLSAQEATVIPNEHTVIPLPPAAWTGLAGLASFFAIRGRKAVARFFR